MLLALLLMLACGESKKETEQETVKMKTAETKQDVEDPNTTTITLLSYDTMKYDKTQLTVPAGKTVKLTLKHVGQMPKNAMGHNFVLLKQDTEVSKFAAKASAARDNDYIPEGTETVIVHTKMLGGGQSDTVTFEPPAPGTYTYICSFPGHYAMMQGTFTVE